MKRRYFTAVVTAFIMIVLALLAMLLFFSNVKADNTRTTYVPMVSKATDWNIFVEPPPGTYNGAGIEVFHDPEVRGWCKALVFDLLTGEWKNRKLTVAYDEYYPCSDGYTGVELWFDEPTWFNTVQIEQYNDDMDLVGIHKKYVGQYRVCQLCGPVPVP